MGGFLGNSTGAERESLFAALDLLFYLSKTAQFEDGSGKLKPLLGGAFSSFAGLKCLQDGTVEMS